MTIVPIVSKDLDALEISWFTPLCSDYYRYLGVPDGNYRSSWENTSEVQQVAGRALDYGLRVHMIVRDTEQEAKEYADELVSKLDDGLGTEIRDRGRVPGEAPTVPLASGVRT